MPRNSSNGTAHTRTRARSIRTRAPRTHAASSEQPAVRFAVVGLGYIAQAALIPAFKNAGERAKLVALVSQDPAKLTRLSRRHDVPVLSTYDHFDEYLADAEVDAVIIALPNSMHSEYSVRAANAGMHVLCEKPMAMSTRECQEMMNACRAHDRKLMIAYRLHFEPANLEAVRIVSSGKVGDPRMFSSTFSMQVKPENIRTDEGLGGGPVWDLGVYCINAARYLFRDEPVEVHATHLRGHEQRFAEIPEATSATLIFPEERVAQFTCSFGAADSAVYTVIGTKGSLCVDSAYEYSEPITHELTINGRTRRRQFPKTDQFAAEILHFATCIQEDRDPQCPGEEGLADVQIIEAILESARRGEAVPIQPARPTVRPQPEDVIRKPAIKPPPLIHARAPSR